MAGTIRKYCRNIAPKLIYQLKNISPITTQQYIEKADHFLQGMKLFNEDVSSYRTGIGLLAVHSAISLSDAITVGLTGKRKTYQRPCEVGT